MQMRCGLLLITKRRSFETFTLVSPLGSAVFEKSRLARYFASDFLTMNGTANLGP